MKPARIILTVVLTTVLSVSWAQEVVIKAELDTTSALIGDQIRLHLTVEKPAGIQVVFPNLMDSLSKDIEIISNSSIDSVLVTTDRYILSRELMISVFDTGFFEIPPLAFIINTGNKQDTLNTLPVSFEILSVKSDSTIRDIKAIYKVPISFRELSPYALLAIITGLLLWFVIRHFKKRRTRALVKPFENSLEPPEIVALRELEQLKEEKPWMHNKVKSYYIRISEILRSYIEIRFQISALEQTTDEIIIALKPPLCKAVDHNCLSGILKLADLVKFAKVIPGDNENAAQIDYATDFVQNTAVKENAGIRISDTEESAVQSKGSI